MVGNNSTGGSGDSSVTPPQTSTWIQKGFHGFLRRYLKRHFSLIGLHREGYNPAVATEGDRPDEPTIVYANHPAWWDPLIAHYLNDVLLAPRQFYAPIDADALKQYRVFEQLGFYGINLKSTSGAAAFLRTSMSILNAPDTSLWITPEGRFCDPRDASASLMPGLAHLCTKMCDLRDASGNSRGGRVIPLALEYVFWEERLPVCIIRFGNPFRPAENRSWDKATWNKNLNERLRQTQQELAVSAIARDAKAFESLMIGKMGAGMFYDTMRRLKSWIKREKFRAEHGERIQ
jgi:1-acyl-sn-glycerol-3-phosphate acyltransferase